MASASKWSVWQAAATSLASSIVITPACACARASAASNSSTACRIARPETRSATPPRASTPANTSEVEEDGFTLALQDDVEPVLVLARRVREQRAPPLAGRRRHVGLIEVDPGDDA